MVFGSLALQVARVNLPDESQSATTVTADLRPGPWEQATIQIWPTLLDAVSWPPPQGLLGDEGIQALSQRWSPV